MKPSDKIKILYLHGLGSGGGTATAKMLQKHFPGAEVISPDIPVHPNQAMAFFKRLASKLGPDDIVVGTSMGGRYAMLFRGWRRIAINPSLHTSRLLRTMMGQDVPFFLPRQDGATSYHVDEGLCREYETHEARQFEAGAGVEAPWYDPAKDAHLVLGLFASHDTLTGHNKGEFLEHFPRFLDFEGDHRLTPQTSRDVLVPVLTQWLAASPSQP